MKIAVSAAGKTAESPVDPGFGRSRGFVLVDSESGAATYVDNAQARGRSSATGIQAAHMIVKAGAEAVITGQIGPKAAAVLQRAGLKVYACSSGTVQEAVRALEQGKLSAFSEEELQTGPGKRGGRGLGGGGRGRGPAQGGRGMGGGARGRGPTQGGRGRGRS